VGLSQSGERLDDFKLVKANGSRNSRSGCHISTIIELSKYVKVFMSDPITIFHNPDCGTSRNVLALIRNTGEEPTVIEYLKTPPSRERIIELLAAMGITPRELLRKKGTPYSELALDDESLSDAALLDAMLAHPILINRPIVETALGTRLCRPSEVVLDVHHRASRVRGHG
jgi:arsenate reductase (glutaredoxin)